MGKILKEQGWHSLYREGTCLRAMEQDMCRRAPDGTDLIIGLSIIARINITIYLLLRGFPTRIVMKGWQPDEQTGLALEYIKKHAEQSDNNDEPLQW